VHAFVNELERTVGTYLYGRRMYDTMVYWADSKLLDDEEPVVRDFAAIWQAADKVVYSTTLESVSTPRTRIERRFDPDAVRRLKAEASSDVTIGGAELAGQALRAGLVDELQLLAVPVLVGGGTRAFPDEVRAELELLEERRFEGGTVFLRYRVRA
jgi:dihydrofolate reductase